MARLPSSFRERNRTTASFRKQFAQLPIQIQLLTRASCVSFNDNPQCPSFRTHYLTVNKRGDHLPESVSVSITLQYRAIYVEEKGVNVWYWIGTHAEYDRFTGRKST